MYRKLIFVVISLCVTVVFPADVVKSRLQVGKSNEGFLKTFTTIARTEGKVFHKSVFFGSISRLSQFTGNFHRRL